VFEAGGEKLPKQLREVWLMPDKLPMKQGFAFLQRTVPFDGKWFFARRG
jgi:hypothetical protein